MRFVEIMYMLITIAVLYFIWGISPLFLALVLGSIFVYCMFFLV